MTLPGSRGRADGAAAHAPLMTALQPGPLVFRKGGVETDVALSGGFLEVRDDKVTILADTAERSDEIDAARAQAARACSEGYRAGFRAVDRRGDGGNTARRRIAADRVRAVAAARASTSHPRRLALLRATTYLTPVGLLRENIPSRGRKGPLGEGGSSETPLRVWRLE